jgi:RNA polymerase sigma-70 factor (family 1)
MQNNPANDHALLSLIAEGDEKAFAALYRLYVPQLLPFINSLVRSDAVADEIIQETFLRIWIGRDKLTNIEEPRAWVFRIAANISYTHLRRTIKERSIIKSIANSQIREEDEVQDLAQASEMAALIRQAIDQLPAQRKKIYRLSREKGMTIPEIAEALGLSKSTVKNTLVTSLQSIREYLRENGYEVPAVITVLFF